MERSPARSKRRARRPHDETTFHFQDGDGFYEQLLDAHQNLSKEESELLNARLILLLANQIGDAKVLKDCIAAARQIASSSPA